MFREVFAFGIVGRAIESRIAAVSVHDLRSFTKDRHRTTDDAAYGGGPGMVMKVEPLVDAVEAVSEGEARVVMLAPRGEPLRQGKALELSSERHLVLVAGRYEGVDERFLEATGAEEISIGDYVLSGGEIPAMVLVDTVVRLLPGAISDPKSAVEDSFSYGMLDYPHYTRPAEYRGLHVPEVLLSGDHAAIRAWRQKQAFDDTRSRRPELFPNRP